MPDEDKTTGTEESTEKPSPTLEDIYSQYNVNEVGTEAPQQKATSQPAQPTTDTGGMSTSSADHAALRQEVMALKAAREEDQRVANARRDKEDLERVVGDLSQQIEGVKPSMLKYALLDKVAEDQRFLQLWNNRDNQSEAFKKAISVVAQDLKNEFGQMTDSQLAENQRALDQATNSASANRPAEESQDKQALNMSQGEFAHFWDKLKSGRG